MDSNKYHQKVMKSSVLRKITTYFVWESPSGQYQPYGFHNIAYGIHNIAYGLHNIAYGMHNIAYGLHNSAYGLCNIAHGLQRNFSQGK